MSATERKVADAVLDDIASAAGATVEQLAEKRRREHRHHLALRPRGGLRRHARPRSSSWHRPAPWANASWKAARRTKAPSTPASTATSTAPCARTCRCSRNSSSRPPPASCDDARMTYVFGMGGRLGACWRRRCSRGLVRLGYGVAAYSDAVLLRMVAGHAGQARRGGDPVHLGPDARDPLRRAHRASSTARAWWPSPTPNRRWRRWPTWCCPSARPRPISSTSPRPRATRCCWPSTSWPTELAHAAPGRHEGAPAPHQAGAGRTPRRPQLAAPGRLIRCTTP